MTHLAVQEISAHSGLKTPFKPPEQKHLACLPNVQVKGQTWPYSTIWRPRLRNVHPQSCTFLDWTACIRVIYKMDMAIVKNVHGLSANLPPSWPSKSRKIFANLHSYRKTIYWVLQRYRSRSDLDHRLYRKCLSCLSVKSFPATSATYSQMSISTTDRRLFSYAHENQYTAIVGMNAIQLTSANMSPLRYRGAFSAFQSSGPQIAPTA